MGFSSGLITGLLAMLFMLMLVVPTAIHFVNPGAPKPIPGDSPAEISGFYREIAVMEIEIYGQTQENGGYPYFDAGITSLTSPYNPYPTSEYGYGHANCGPGLCVSYGYGWTDEDGRPW